MSSLRIVALSGSLRAGSFNTALIKAAQKLCPPEATIEFVEIGHLPLYNTDVELTRPEVITEFKDKIKAADAVLFVSPEYNYSFSGVLKNAIDWASRPKEDNAWSGKPGAIMGASGGTLGTARMQYHLRQVLTAVNVLLINRPEVMVSSAQDKFSVELELTDEHTKEKVKQMLEALVAWTKQLKK